MITDKTVPLCLSFNQAMLTLANETMPKGFDVIKNAPDTLESLVQHYNATGRIAVEESGSGGCTMGIPEQHYAFRAWHDLQHVLQHRAFTIHDETLLARAHQMDIVNRFGFNASTLYYGALVETEIVAQNLFAVATGDYPNNPREFALNWLSRNGFERFFDHA